MSITKTVYWKRSTLALFVTAAAMSNVAHAVASTDWIDGDDRPVKATVKAAPKASEVTEQDDLSSATDIPKTYKAESTASGGTLLKGQVSFCVPRGTPIKLKIAMVPTSSLGLKMAQRDLDGKLFPAQI